MKKKNFYSQTGNKNLGIHSTSYMCQTSVAYLIVIHKIKKNTVEPWFMKASHHEQIGSQTNFLKKKSRLMNGVPSNEHVSRQQRLATSWDYWQENVSCCVTFTQYTSLLKFAVPSLVFHCFVVFF
jgi:hypothetical protein